MDNEILIPGKDTAEAIDFEILTSPVYIVDTKSVDLEEKDAEFRVSESPDRAPRVAGIGSSDVEDLAGDRMLRSALDDMCSFGVKSAIWLNHSYNLPEDVFGFLAEAPTVKTMNPDGHGAIKAQRPYYAVEILCDVAKRNPRAMETYSFVQDGIKVGFSIGCKINDFTVRKDKSGAPRGLDIKSVTPLEWSAVGIPANQQSWAREAVKGLVRKGRISKKALQDETELAHILKNFSDFDAVDAVILRRISESFDENFQRTGRRLYIAEAL